MRVRLTKTLTLSSKKMLDKKCKHKIKQENKSNESVFRFYKTSSTLPRVVWAEESKNGLGFEIGPNYDNVPTRSQFLTDRQSSCRARELSVAGVRNPATPFINAYHPLLNTPSNLSWETGVEYFSNRI